MKAKSFRSLFPSLSRSLFLVYVNKVRVGMLPSAVLSFTYLNTSILGLPLQNQVPLWATALFVLLPQTFSQPASSPTGTLPEVLLLTCGATFLRPAHFWCAQAKVWRLGCMHVGSLQSQTFGLSQHTYKTPIRTIKGPLIEMDNF